MIKLSIVIDDFGVYGGPGEVSCRVGMWQWQGGGARMIDYDFINAPGCGMLPTGGVGVGICSSATGRLSRSYRLVMLLTNNNSIKEVILFPQMKSVQLESPSENQPEKSQNP